MAKSFFVAGVGLYFLLATVVTFAAQPPSQLANVTIAYTSISPQYSPAWIAKETGIFRKYGINTKIVEKLDKQGFIDALYRR